jgi:hypothetical protein
LAAAGSHIVPGTGLTNNNLDHRIPANIIEDSSSSDQDTRTTNYLHKRTMPNNLASATDAHVEQDGPSKIPIMTEGDPSPEVMQEFENGCLDHFGNKDIAPEKQTARILPGFKDPRIRAHINANRERLTALSFRDFMKELRELYLPPDWEEDLRRSLMSATMGSGSFWDYASKIQNQNILLIGTQSHLLDDKLRHQLEVGMTDRLARKCKAEKTQEIEEFRAWLLDVKRIDDAIRADRVELFEEIAKNSRAESRKTNPLGEPSRRGNTSYNYRSSNPNTQGSTSTAPRARVPKLTEDERTLLYNNQGCLKCRRVFVEHKMADCPNGFPDPTKYKTLTQAHVDRVRARVGRTVAAMTRESPEPEVEETSHPIGAIVPTSRYPIAYMPPNQSSILQRDGDSDSDESVSCIPRALLGAVPTPTSDEAGNARFFSPHLMWQCTMPGPSFDFPVAFTAMLDTGCPTVLIREEVAVSMGFHRRLLPRPESFDVALQDPNAKKETVVLKEWCKITVADPSASWQSKSIRAIIAPRLCSDIILGMTFLGRNSIVIDTSARTAIDKTCNFDLLNPVTAKPPRERPLTLLQSAKKVKGDLKKVQSELKRVLEQRKVPAEPELSKSSVIGAVRERIEILAGLEKLKALGERVKTEFKDVFEPIPHVDELPTDVYCRIKLKDSARTIASRSYSCPRKYKEAWSTLIQQHLDAGRI